MIRSRSAVLALALALATPSGCSGSQTRLSRRLGLNWRFTVSVT